MTGVDFASSSQVVDHGQQERCRDRDEIWISFDEHDVDVEHLPSEYSSVSANKSYKGLIGSVPVGFT